MGKFACGLCRAAIHREPIAHSIGMPPNVVRSQHESISGLLPRTTRSLLRLRPQTMSMTHQIKTFWDGRRPSPASKPKPEHTAMPGFVTAGCWPRLSTAMARVRPQRQCIARKQIHGQSTAVPLCHRITAGDLSQAYTARPRARNSRAGERNKGRKVVVDVTVFADGLATAKGEIIALQMPDTFIAAATS